MYEWDQNRSKTYAMVAHSGVTIGAPPTAVCGWVESDPEGYLYLRAGRCSVGDKRPYNAARDRKSLPRQIRFFMRFNILTLLLCAMSGLPAAQVWATDFQTRVVMIEKPAATFYVATEINGFGPAELMVDTGSGYVTINESTLGVLQANGQARYVKPLRGILADGRELTVPVYVISAMRLGENCWLHDLEAAVFPGDSRQILGLSALRKAAPFVFSVDPPELQLSRCAAAPPVATAAPALAASID